MALAATGCGFLIYPERRGRTGGEIDAPILIVDLLWLLPGLIPGVICLAVDFSSGCIYRGGGRHRYRALSPDGRDPRPALAAVIINGEVVARTEVLPDRSAPLSWSREVDTATLRARGRLVLKRSDGVEAEGLVKSLL